MSDTRLIFIIIIMYKKKLSIKGIILNYDTNKEIKWLLTIQLWYVVTQPQ